VLKHTFSDRGTAPLSLSTVQFLTERCDPSQRRLSVGPPARRLSARLCGAAQDRLDCPRIKSIPISSSFICSPRTVENARSTPRLCRRDRQCRGGHRPMHSTAYSVFAVPEFPERRRHAPIIGKFTSWRLIVPSLGSVNSARGRMGAARDNRTI